METFLVSREMADRIVSFHNHFFRDHRKPEHWIWEYKGIYADLSVFSAATENGDIIGTLGAIPVFVRAGDERILSAKYENALVVRNHRGGKASRDIFNLLEAECKSKGFQCAWGYGPTYKASLRHGVSAYPDAICSLGAVLRPTRGTSDKARPKKKRSLSQRIKRIAARPLFWLYGSILRAATRPSIPIFSIRPALFRQEDLDDLYQRLRDRYPNMIHIDLDERYLRWRIYNHPIFEYKSYFVYEDTQLRAYAFINANSQTRAYMTDFTFEHENAGKVLLARILDDLKSTRAGLVIFIGNRENPLIKKTFKLLRRWGFLRIGSTNFQMRNLQSQSDSLVSNPENWYMTGIGGEGFDA
ncbi:MAG TPA: hypothetical protein VK463_06880 [Desulfomonilaceae bacterium]|nr:hypothetical protein [Desulfomonilaceae bacterium]